MPHAGLMNADEMGPEAAALQRAKLHIRAGKRRLRQRKVAAGIVTLYDALSAAMEWYMFSPKRRDPLFINAGEDLNDDNTIYNILVRSGVLDGNFDSETFNRIVIRAFDESLTDYDYSKILEGLESVMTQIGIMPFDESELPAEDPSTY
jgi:hypothetical protein